MTAKTELRTKRLLLRPFEVEDVADVLAYRDDEVFARFLPHIPQPFTQRDAEDFVRLNRALDWARSPTFAIVLGGRVVGTVNLEVDAQARSAMLGFAIGRAWWGSGLAAEAAEAAMSWGSDTFDLTRIWASTDVRNLQSQRVLRKLGMQRESRRPRDHLGRDGEWVDEVVYSRDLT